MKKMTQKAVAMLTLIVMIISLLPAMALPAFAASPDAADAELDYDALFEDAYIVWPSGSTTAKTWSFKFRGETKSVTYSSSKCFKSFSAAQSAFIKAVGTEGVVTETPVYVLIGTVTMSGTIYGNAIFLGANAGISPNADIDIADKQLTAPDGTWDAATRGTETVIRGTFTHANTTGYDTAAKNAGVKKYDIIIDGIKTDNLTTTLINDKATQYTDTTAKTINYSIRNSILDFNKNTIYSVTCSADKINTINVDFKNIRMDGSVQKAVVDNYAANVTVDGLFYKTTVYPFIANYVSADGTAIDVGPEKYSFTMKNSVINGAASATQLFTFGRSLRGYTLNFDNNIFYYCGGKWGIMTYAVSSDYSNAYTEVNFRRNLVMEQSSSERITLFQGGDMGDGAYALNVTQNRVIGYDSVIPNINLYPTDQTAAIQGTVAYNYISKTFSSVNDTTGVAPSYSATGYDQYHFSGLVYTNDTTQTILENAIYYTDYKMTETSNKFDITETDFFDDLDYISINNAARIIRLRVASGVTVSGLSKSYGFNFVTEPDSVTFSKTSLSSTSTASVTMKVTHGGSSVTYTIYPEAQTTPISYTELDTYDGSGTFVDNRLYLYSPSGATTATIDGITYNFSGRSYTTMAGIFSAAGSYKIPQIIIPAGEYSAISVTKPCEIYGASYDSPATGGKGMDRRAPGDKWRSAKDTVINGITLSSGISSSYLSKSVIINGIVLTGAFTDTANTQGITIDFKNSVINGGYFNLQNTGTTSKTAGGLYLTGVKVNAVGTAGKLITSTNMPYIVSLDNVEFAGANVALGGYWASGLSSSACSLTVKNSFFNSPANSVFGDITNSTKFASATVTISDSAFIKNESGRAYPSLLGIDPSYLKSLTLTNNWFVNTGTAYQTLFASTSGSVATFTGNRLIGYDLGGVSATKNNNYYAPYTADYLTKSNGRPYGSTYYLDPNLTVKNTDLSLSSVTGGTAIIDNTLRTVYVNATGAVSLTFSNGASYSVYADRECTVAATLSGEGTYYVKVYENGLPFIYNVRVDGGDSADFSDTFVNDFIGTGALYATTLITEDYYGQRVSFDIDGITYSFVAGITAFANVRDALEYAAEKGVSDPKVILGTYQSNLSIPTKAKIYGGNYSTVPYTKTTDADLDWNYNEAYDTHKTSVANIQIGAEASDKVEIHGVEMKGYYLDVVRPASKTLNVYINNLLVNKTSTDSRVLFDLNGNNAMSASNTETFSVKDAYVQSALKTRLLYEFYPANVTFDGLYIDGNTFEISTINYVKNSGTSTTLTFKNSNLRNYVPTTSFAFLFQGDDTALVSGESKKLVFENNVFYNFSFGNSAFIPMQTAKLSEVVFTNNKVINSTATHPLFCTQANTANIGLKFTVTDNLLLGINPESNIGSNTVIDTANSVVARNHTTATCSTEKSGSAITITGTSTLTESVFALDDTMSPLYTTDFVLENVYSDDNSIYEKEITSSTITLKVADGVSAADFDWVFASEKVVPTFYSNSACTTTVDASTVVKGTSYYMKASFTADDGTVWTGDKYFVKLIDSTTDFPLFSHPLIDDGAILVDSNVDTSKTYYNSVWDDDMYTFVVGKNVFATLDEAIANAGENPSFLIKDINGESGDTEINTWLITTPGKYYTQNFNRAPYIASDRADDPDGSEWKSNINTGDVDSFFTSYGIKVKWLVLNTAKAGNYEFHGFTITNCIQDDDIDRAARSSDNDINVLFNNTYLNKIHSDSPVFNVGTHFMLDSTGAYLTDATATAFNDSVTLKNTYYVNTSTKDLFSPNGSSNTDIAYNVNPWTHLTIDGMFADYTNTTVADTMYIGSYGKEYTFTVKNSNLRNKVDDTAMWYFEGHNGKGVDYGTSYPQTRSLIFEDNIFYNFSLYNATTFLQYKNTYFNEITFVDNYIYTVADNMNLGAGTEGNAVHPDPYVTITDNVFMGINPDYKLNRWVTWDHTTVKDNYCTPTRPADTSKTSYNGQKFVLYVNNWKYDTDGTTKVYFQTNGHYWLDSAKTLSADVIQPMTLSNGTVLDANNTGAEITIAYDTTVLNLNDILLNPGNILSVSEFGTPIEDITAINVATDTILELTVQAASGVGDPITCNLLITHDTNPQIAAISATLYNGISLNFKATGCSGTEYISLEFLGETHTLTAGYTEDNYTVFTFNNIAPQYMRDNMVANLIRDDETLHTYTVCFADYCESVMYDNIDNDVVYDLVCDILNYGSQAQLYKNYNTDNLANQNLASVEQTVTAPSLTNSINTSYKTVTNAKASWAAHSLILDNAIEMKLGFTANTPVSKLSVKVENASGTTVATLQDCFWYEDGKYYFIFDDFTVTQASDVFYFTLMNGTTAISNTLAYSAESYASVSKNNATLKNLTNALINYTNAATAYKNSL